MPRRPHIAAGLLSPASISFFAVFLNFRRRATRLGGAALVCVLGLTAASVARAQAPVRIFAPNYNLWTVFNAEPRFSARWGMRAEVIYRRASWAQALQQCQFRVAPVWNPRPDLQLSVGYLFSRNFRYGDYPVLRTFSENRLYEQLLLRSTFGRFALAHRYRLEQRWQCPALAADPTRFVTVYTNRARYQTRLSRPLGSDALGPYAAISGEVFVSFGSKVANNIFDQARAYGGIGWQFTPAVGLELGYLHQLSAQGNGRIFEANHTLQFTLIFNPTWAEQGTLRPQTTDSMD